MKKRSYELLIANRKYKDTIFRWIFSILENLLSLYNAVTGKNYQNPEELVFVFLIFIAPEPSILTWNWKHWY